MKDICIQGICYDKKSSFLNGPALAPGVIRDTLHNGASNYYTEAGTNINTEQVSDLGDYQISEYFDIEKISGQNLKSGHLLTLGGDHSITYPIIRAVSNVASPLSILHIDAHADLYHEFEGDPYSHACPFARIMEERLAARLVQVGIRTLNPHQMQEADKYDVQILVMTHFGDSRLPVMKGQVYISLDMDAFDPAYAPGVSHHEPGGLSPRQVIDLIHSIEGEVIGADIVEYNPNRDIHHMTAALAAKMTKEILGKMIESHQ